MCKCICVVCIHVGAVVGLVFVACYYKIVQRVHMDSTNQRAREAVHVKRLNRNTIILFPKPGSKLYFIIVNRTINFILTTNPKYQIVCG